MLALGIIAGVILILLGVPVFIAFAGGGGIICAYYLGIPWFTLGQLMFNACTHYVLLAIPFFILAANLMLHGGVAKRLIDVCTLFFGHWRGGLAIAMIIAMGFFGAMCGSILAAIVAIGGVMTPLMVEKGYPKSFCAALAASAAGLDVLIPPSNTAIIYGAITGESVAKAFAAGVIPGIFQMTVLVLVAMAVVRKMKLEPNPKASWGERWRGLRRAVGALIMPIIILGSIYGGICTPTEAAALACLGAIIIGVLIHRELSPSRIWIALKDSTRATAMIFIIIAAASFLSIILTYTQIPQQITEKCLSLAISPLTFLFAAALACLILGTFMEAVPNWYLTTPIMYVIATALKVDPFHLYISMGAFIGVGLLTPPVCVGAYTAAGVVDVPPHEVLKYVFPTFFLTLMFCGFIYILFPSLSTWLPGFIR
jgi:C4-dicarboxylate transporter DctM subunit